MNYSCLVGVQDDFLVCGSCVEAVKDEWEVAIVRFDHVDGGDEGGVVHIFSPTAGIRHDIVVEHQET